MIFQITLLVSEWKSSLATYIKAEKVKQQRPNKNEETDFVTEVDPTQTGVAHRSNICGRNFEVQYDCVYLVSQ